MAAEDVRFYPHHGVDYLGHPARRLGEPPRRPGGAGRIDASRSRWPSSSSSARSARSPARRARRCWPTASRASSPRTRSSASTSITSISATAPTGRRRRRRLLRQGRRPISPPPRRRCWPACRRRPSRIPLQRLRARAGAPALRPRSDAGAGVPHGRRRPRRRAASRWGWSPSARLTNVAAPYFVETIRRHVADNYGDEELLERGLRVYTTLNMRAQRAAEAAVRARARGPGSAASGSPAPSATSAPTIACASARPPAPARPHRLRCRRRASSTGPCSAWASRRPPSSTPPGPGARLPEPDRPLRRRRGLGGAQPTRRPRRRPRPRFPTDPDTTYAAVVTAVGQDHHGRLGRPLGARSSRPTRPSAGLAGPARCADRAGRRPGRAVPNNAPAPARTGGGRPRPSGGAGHRRLPCRARSSRSIPHTGHLVVDGRRLRLREEPVQPRHPGPPPDRLGHQAVHLRRRDRSRHDPADHQVGRAGEVQDGLGRLGPAQLQARLPRARSRCAPPSPRASTPWRRSSWRRWASTRSSTSMRGLGISSTLPHALSLALGTADLGAAGDRLRARLLPRRRQAGRARHHHAHHRRRRPRPRGAHAARPRPSNGSRPRPPTSSPT